MVDTLSPSGGIAAVAVVMPGGVAARNRISKRIYILPVPLRATAGTCDAMGRLHVSPAWIALAAAAFVAFAGAFALARATAPTQGSSPRGLAALRAGGGTASLPHLSQAPDLPALAAPAPAASAPAPASSARPPVPPPAASPARKKPVVIVGSG
jgi:hypothetical protein